MKRALAALALVACGGKHREGVDWTACDAAIAAKKPWPELLAACPVCDFDAMLKWDVPSGSGGPTPEHLSAAMVSCDAFCTGAAKDRFLGTIDQARGMTRAPWRYLGEMCKDKVGATPDSMRFLSPAWFALDRLARRVGAHGGDAASHLAGLDIPLPPLTVTGAGLDLPPVSSAPIMTGEIVVTVTTEDVFVGRLPHARVDASGIHLFEGEPYPGHASTDVDADVRALGAKDDTPIGIIAGGAVPAERVDSFPRTIGRWHMDGVRGQLPGGWPELGIQAPLTRRVSP